MMIKKLLLSGLLACGAMSFANEGKHPLSTGILSIDQIEVEQFQNYMVQKQQYRADSVEAQELIQHLKVKAIEIISLLQKKMSELKFVNEKDALLQQIKIALDVVKQDSELTLLVKTLVGIYGSSIINFVEKNFDDLQALKQQGQVDINQICKLFAHMLPQGADFVDIFVNSVVLNHTLLLEIFENQGKLTIEDLLEVLRKVIDSWLLSDDWKKYFIDIIDSVGHSFKELQKDVVDQLLKETEKNLKNNNWKNTINQMKLIVENRKEFKSHGVVSAEQLENYSKQLKDLFDNLSKVEANTMPDKYSLYEKMIFKN